MTAQIVTCLWDGRSWTSTFEFISFLAVADAARRFWHPQTIGMEVLILTGAVHEDRVPSFRNHDFTTGHSNPREFDANCLSQIVLPLTGLVPSVLSVTVFDTLLGQKPSTLGKFIFYPGGVDVDNVDQQVINSVLPRNPLLFAFAAAAGDMRVVKNSNAVLHDARAYARRLVGSENPIAITLRRNRFSTDYSRDNVESYVEIARHLSKQYPVVVVPDTADVPAGMDIGLPVAYEAALNLKLRSALYEVARANFCGSSGPGMLMMLNKECTYYISNLITERTGPAFWGNVWTVASEYLKALRLDPDGSASKRLEILKGARNFFSPESLHQVVEYHALTIEKAEGFLASLADRVHRKPS